MTLSMYQASIPIFRQMLENLAAILDKGAAHAAARKIEPGVLLGLRLYPDMISLVGQVQIATDHAKGASARLAGVEVPKYVDNETSFEDLKKRIHRTLDFIGKLTPAQIDGSEDREIALSLAGQSRIFKGQNYLINFALPNFYFHVTTAYDILRHSGVELGKRDFIGLSNIGKPA